MNPEDWKDIANGRDLTCCEIVDDAPCGRPATRYNATSHVLFCDEHGGKNPRLDLRDRGVLSLTRDEWLLIEWALMGIMNLKQRAKDLGLNPNNVRVKVTKVIEKIRA